jgi:hypothetical protein
MSPIEDPIIKGIVCKLHHRVSPMTGDRKNSGSQSSTIPADVRHEDGSVNADSQRQTAASSGIPTHAAGVACSRKFTTNSNLEHPNDQGKRQDEYDRDLK